MDGTISVQVLLGALKQEGVYHEGQASKQQSFVEFDSAQLAQDSSPVGAVSLTSYKVEQSYGNGNEMKPFLPRLLVIMVFHHSNSDAKRDRSCG